jgi:hypothetical protein
MLNIRLEEGDIHRIMEIALGLQQKRGDYRLGAATVIEAMVRRVMDNPTLLNQVLEEAGAVSPRETALKKLATGRRG